MFLFGYNANVSKQQKTQREKWWYMFNFTIFLPKCLEKYGLQENGKEDLVFFPVTSLIISPDRCT